MVYIHISMGLISLLAGLAAMISAKGGGNHRRWGQIFAVAMLAMAATGAIRAILIPEAASILGGLLTVYLVSTAWAAGRRRPFVSGIPEVCALAAALGISALALNWGLQALALPDRLLHGMPSTIYFIFFAIGVYCAARDMWAVLKRELSPRARLGRHLGRMCFAFFMATASFFLGQAALFPQVVQDSGVLFLPVLVLIAASIYWVVRVRFFANKPLNRWRSARTNKRTETGLGAVQGSHS